MSDTDPTPTGQEKKKPEYRADLQHLDSPYFPHHAQGAEQAEVDKLVKWVEEYLVPTFVYAVRQDQPWCPRWIEHDDAVTFLHAVFRAFQGQINTEGKSGMTGPSTWLHHHLLPTLRYLRDPQGPFKRCARSSSKVEHQLPEQAPAAAG